MASTDDRNGFRVRAWRGAHMALLGFDVDAPEPDFVGFTIEVKGPNDADFNPLNNRIAFSYPEGTAVTGARNFPSTAAPFQKFRWVHFPANPVAGTYAYRVTKMHMPTDGVLQSGEVRNVTVPLGPFSVGSDLDIGFTRGFASSQAYFDRFKNANVMPAKAALGLGFDKASQPKGVYEWLGFEAAQMIFDLVRETLANSELSLDVLAYDLNEPDLVALFEQFGPRLRIVIDDSGDHGAGSAETQAAIRLLASGATVKRMHFNNLQHHKVLIQRPQNGNPTKVLFGSTNFSFRGLYIQSNNAALCCNGEVGALFLEVFEKAFSGGNGFSGDALAKTWHDFPNASPPMEFCMSPHADPNLSLGRIGDAIRDAQSSVFFSIAFLNQILSGPVREQIDNLSGRPVLSYGIINQTGKSLKIMKPDGTEGIVSFAFLAENAPVPFNEEWSGNNGNTGINIHHKFVVTDFNTPNASVFTGSCNMAPSGERNNGDNLVCIRDSQIATAYAIEAILMFDHLHFRSKIEGVANLAAITLQRPIAFSGAAAPWYARDYVADSQTARDRLLFSS